MFCTSSDDQEAECLVCEEVESGAIRLGILAMCDNALLTTKIIAIDTMFISTIN